MDKINIGKEIKVLDKGFVRLIDYMGDDSAIVQAARVSYGEGTKTVNEDRGLIRYLLRHHHTTPFEMCLAGDTRIQTFSTGRAVVKHYTIKHLAESFEKGGKENSWVKLVNIRTANPQTGLITSTKIKKVWKTGNQKVYRVSVEDAFNRSIKLTSNHPFLTPEGFKTIDGGLKVGDYIMLNGLKATDVEIVNEMIRRRGEGDTLVDISNAMGLCVSLVHKYTQGMQKSKRKKGFLKKKIGEHSDPRAIARRVLLDLKKCGVLNCDKDASDRHHIDENPHNNDLSNLIGLCPKHHRHIHTFGLLEKAFPAKIKSIEEVGVEDVYDLEVFDNNHTFVAEGIVVHNCEFKFHVKLPMFIARQWIRHRTACLSGDTTIKVLAKDDGFWVNTFPLKDLYERFKKDPNLTIQNFNEDTQEIQYDKVLDIYESGVKQVWEWQFTGGVSIRCTEDHLVYTTLGWMKMEEVLNNREKVQVHSNIQFQKTTSSLIGKVFVGKEMTYDISMGGKHKNFYANDIVVHNSVNEESGRYSILKDEFYVPDLDRMVIQSATNKQGSSDDLISNPYLTLGKIEMEQQHSYEQYEKYLEDGLARETARINLPLSTYTQWYWKINLHNLLHFLRLRADVHAQKEIRDYANAIIELIKDIVPLTFEAFEDYVVGSMSFSKMELSIFKHLFGENKDKVLMDFDYKEMGLSKREWEEFIIKINKVS